LLGSKQKNLKSEADRPIGRGRAAALPNPTERSAPPLSGVPVAKHSCPHPVPVASHSETFFRPLLRRDRLIPATSSLNVNYRRRRIRRLGTRAVFSPSVEAGRGGANPTQSGRPEHPSGLACRRSACCAVVLRPEIGGVCVAAVRQKRGGTVFFFVLFSTVFILLMLGQRLVVKNKLQLPV
jgi:hypothetical protein